MNKIFEEKLWNDLTALQSFRLSLLRSELEEDKAGEPMPQFDNQTEDEADEARERLGYAVEEGRVSEAKADELEETGKAEEFLENEL